MGPLHGIRIIDLTSVLMGPFASQIMGDMGADVVKVESPAGDLVRLIGPSRHADMGPIFLNTNRNKRSIVLDLKQPAGLAAVKRLLADADVLLYNIRPQAMSRLGLDYETVAALNPRIVYAGLFGYGQDGPYAARPAYDDLIQGASTIPSLFARASGGIPRYVPTAIGDRIVGQAAVGPILAALLARVRTGRGDRVDVPMFETMVAFVLGDHLGGLTFDPPLDRGGYARQLASDRRPYRTRDGYICAMVYNDKQWASFLAATGRDDLARDPRFKDFATRSRHTDFVYGILATLFEERTTRDWTALLEDADIPFAPMHDLESVLDDPHLAAVGFFPMQDHPSEGRIRTMRAATTFSRNTPEPPRPVPRLGEHTVEILRDAGFAQADIDALLASGVARQDEPLAAGQRP